MRLKDGQLLPCYNVQLSSQNQFILHYTVGQNPADQYEFAPHLESLPDGITPIAIVGDSGYGSEINYQLSEQQRIEPFF